jgi:hypothetical protein
MEDAICDLEGVGQIFRVLEEAIDRARLSHHADFL